MPLMPKRVKFRKSQRGKVRGKATRGNTVSYGEFGLQSLEGGWLSAEAIDKARQDDQGEGGGKRRARDQIAGSHGGATVRPNRPSVQSVSRGRQARPDAPSEPSPISAGPR